MRASLIGIFYLIATLNFVSAQSSHPDCINPFPVCEKVSYHFENLNGEGFSNDLKSEFRCTPNNFKEMNSHWMKFSIEKSGTLTFSINPERENHDVDFILFRANNFSCSSLEDIRCMATGQSLGASQSTESKCLGSTGLRMDSSDEFEYFGCKLGDDNYLKFLQAEENEEFILFINDYHTNGAISVTFEGSAEFKNLKDCASSVEINDLQISKLFPNPASESINIEFTSAENKTLEIDVLDMRSKVFYSQNHRPEGNINIKEIDIKSLPSGPYLIRIKQGRQVAVKQFVKI